MTRGGVENVCATDATAFASSSGNESRDIAPAPGPPTHVVSSGARTGYVVQHTGNAARPFESMKDV